MARWGFFGVACFVIYRQLLDPKDTQVLGTRLLEELQGSNSFILIAVLLLVPLNWGLESAKWRYLMRRIQAMPFYRAAAAVLVGTGLGLFTPNRTGEFLGRVLFIDPGHRIKAAFGTALGSLAQFVVTLVMGTLSLGFYLLLELHPPLEGTFINNLMMVLSFSIAGVSLITYLYPGILKRAVELIPILKGWRKHAEVLVEFSKEELVHVLILSAVRYMIFAMQFVLVLITVSDYHGLLNVFITTCLMYLITTLVPTIVLTELGVRGAVATTLFVPLGMSASSVLFSTFTIWCFNLLLPAMVGALLFLFAQIKWSKSDSS